MKFHIPDLDVNAIYELDGIKFMINSYSISPYTKEKGCWINCGTLGKPDEQNECFSSDFWNVHFKEKIKKWIPVECQFKFHDKIQDQHSKFECIVTTIGWYPFTEVVWYNNTVSEPDAVRSGQQVGFMCDDK